MSASAHAQDAVPATVVVDIEACDELDRAGRLRALLATELRADGVGRVIDDVERAAHDVEESIPPAEGPAAEPPGTLARIEVRGVCADDEAEVTIVDLATDKTLHRSVPLADVDASARPRVLAFAVAALLRASWTELVFREPAETDPEVLDGVRRGATRRLQRALEERELGGRLGTPVEEGLRTPPALIDPRPAESLDGGSDTSLDSDPSGGPSDEPSEEPAARTDRWQLGASASAHLFFAQPTWTVGGRIFAGWSWFRAGLTAEAGLAEATLGEITYALVLAQAEAEPLRHDVDGVAQLSLRLRFSIGFAHVSGSARSDETLASSADAFAVGGEAIGALRVPLGEELAFEVELGLGGLSGTTATVDGLPAASLDGLFASAAMGLAH